MYDRGVCGVLEKSVAFVQSKRTCGSCDAFENLLQGEGFGTSIHGDAAPFTWS
jgi:hypothetical protein